MFSSSLASPAYTSHHGKPPSNAGPDETLVIDVVLPLDNFNLRARHMKGGFGGKGPKRGFEREKRQDCRRFRESCDSILGPRAWPYLKLIPKPPRGYSCGAGADNDCMELLFCLISLRPIYAFSTDWIS
jgi:hypothetical protein